MVGDHINERLRNLDDVGSRFQHYSELLEDMREAQILMEGFAAHRKLYNDFKLQFERLQHAIPLLEGILAVAADVKNQEWHTRDKVDFINKDPEKIIGGRGTPLTTLYPHLKTVVQHINE